MSVSSVLVSNVRTHSCLALAMLIVAGGSQALHAQDAASPTSLFRHSRTYVGPSFLANGPVASRAGGLTIVPTFDSSITNDSNGTAIMATINAALTELASNFSDPVTVTVTFTNVKNGLGASSTSYTTVTYADFLTALTAHATTADDKTALAHVPVQPNNPVNGDPNISLTLSNARALGFSASPDPGETDSTVSLNISLMNVSPSDSDPNKYSLRETTLHELTEVLGSSSALDGGTTGPVSPIDLFRYDSMGNRSYTQSASAVSFFSIDGTTMLAQFNQDKSGDFGDYYSVNGGQKPQIQDAFGTPGVSNLQLGAELIELDVVGYTRVSSGSGGTSGGTPTGGTTPMPPVITSPASCNPNPAYVGGVCMLTVGASDPNNSPITVAWDFGDGTKGADVSASHTFTTGGMYTVTATVVDGLGLSTTSSVVVDVSLTINKAASIKKSFTLNFKIPNDQGGASGGNDRIDITLQNNDFTMPADGGDIAFIIGGNTIDTGTLQNNKAFGDFGKFTLNVRLGTIRYTATKAGLQFVLNSFGAVNNTVNTTLQIPISVSFNGGIYGDTYSFLYTATSGKMGKGK